MTVVTWNPSDKSSGMNLGNSNLDALYSGNNATEGVRGTVSYLTSKRYIEFKMIATRSADDLYAGIANATLGLTSNPVFSSNAHLLWRYGGNVQINGSNVGTLAMVAGDVGCVAIDCDAKKIWIRKNGGSWLGGGDPAAGTTPTGTYTDTGANFPLHITDNAPAGTYNMRIHGDDSNVEFTIPTGFEAWSTSNITLAITGVSGTSAAGTLVAGAALALSGLAGTSGVGSLGEVTAPALSSVSATGAVGTLTRGATSLALSTVLGAGSPGTLVPGNTEALGGLAGTGGVGTVVPGDSIVLPGLSGTGAVGTLGVVIDVNVTVALTGVLAVGSVGSLSPSGGSFPALPFSYQLVEDGPRYAIIRVAPNIDVDLPVSLLVDPQNLASIIPGWPSGPKATRLAIESVQYSTPAALVLDIWWAGPTPVLALTVNGVETEDFRAKGGLQNNAVGTAGQILLSTRGLSGNQSFSLALKLIKQGGFG